MSAVLAFNCGAASRQDVMKAANIPGGEFTFEGCKKKDAIRMRHSAKKAKSKEKERRRKTSEVRLAVNQEKGETSSYASGKFNEADPLNFMESSSDEDDYPLTRHLVDNDSEDNDDYLLATLLSNNASENSDDAPLAHYMKS